MKIALKEAKKGIGRTSPNPCVGAVVVREGSVVGKGYHKKAGTPHAEVHALRAAGDRTTGATLYVTLEPCNHKGRTPPCTQAILRSGIRRVVVGMSDPNPEVTGGGCDFLAERGIIVRRGVLAESCREINLPFIKRVTTGFPWVTIKAGISLDGRIATRTGHSAWITNDQSRREVHRLRNQADAILVGSGTALNDDPSLTTRLPGRRGRDPLRVILDTDLRLPLTARLLTQPSSAGSWIFCRLDHDRRKRRLLESAGAEIRPVPLSGSGLDLRAVLSNLGRAHLNSVLVEGGGRVHGSFLRTGLVDQACLFVAPIFIGADGVPLVDGLGVKMVDEAYRLRAVKVRRFGGDVMIAGRFATAAD